MSGPPEWGNDERAKRVRKLRDELATSSEARLVIDFQMAAKTYRVFLGNDAELRQLLSRTSDIEVALKLWSIENHPAFDAFLDEVDRLLHNYLAAVASLRNHTSQLWSKHLPGDTAYAERAREAFTESGLCLFVQKLRNYAVHWNLPLTRGQMSWERETDRTKTGVMLNRPDLLKWDGWSAPARRYLLDLPDDDLDLSEIVDEYTAVVTRFNDWFGEAFVDRCAASFRQITEWEDELIQLVQPSTEYQHPGPPPASPD